MLEFERESALANEKPTTSGGGDPTATSAGPRLGGARADFVASLGRKIADLRAVMGTLETAPDASLARDELRRKLHALGTGARMMHFDGMAKSIQDTQSVLDRAAEEGQVRATDLERIARALDDLPALAWGEERPSEVGKSMPPASVGEVDGPPSKAMAPHASSVLVIGPEDLADMLVDEAGNAGTEPDFEIERTEDLKHAHSVALAFAPDVVVLDGDLEGAADFSAKLLDDPLTETAPIVVALTPGHDDATTRFQALGVTNLRKEPR